MPGVPSSRACDACKKSKKKCDQIQPSCSRCVRLNISCIGNGQRRFKFVEDQAIVKQYHTPAKTLSNKVTLLTASFLAVLRVDDARYDVTVYGTFLKELPKRIGNCIALDASIGAVTKLFPGIVSRQRSVQGLDCYNMALRKLRICLDDSSQTGTTNVLCAVYLMMVCQAWAGDYLLWGHGQMLSHMLSIIASRGWDDAFDYELLVTLCIPVIIESIGNPKIQMQPWLDKITAQRDEIVTYKSLQISRLAKLKDFINDPLSHEVDMREFYEITRTDISNMQQIPELVLKTAGSKIAGMPHSTFLRQFQAAYCLTLCSAMIINTILLRTFEPSNFIFAQESVILVDQIIKLSEEAAQFRPLGASAMPAALMCAWGATEGMPQRGKVEQLFLLYQPDFPMATWKMYAQWLDIRLTTQHTPYPKPSGCSIM